MRWLHIALKDLRVLGRDRVALAISLLMPFTLILILSFALAPVFQGNTGIARFQVGFADADGGPLAQALHDVFTSPQLRDLIDLQPGEAADLRAQVAQGKLAAAVLIPQGFSNLAGALLVPEGAGSPAGAGAGPAATGSGPAATGSGPASAAGSGRAVTVVSDPGQPVRAGIVEAVVDAFTRQVSAGIFGSEAAVHQLVVAGALPPAQADALGRQLGLKLAQPGAVGIALQSLAPRQGVSAGQYYAAGMAVMFLFYGAMFGVQGFQTEKEAHTLERLLSTPTARGAVVAGKLAAVLLAVGAQLTLLVLATRWLLGVRWGDPLGVALLGGAAAFAATGIVTFVATVATTPRAADVAVQLVTQFSALLGGSMIPLYAFPEGLRWVSKLTVNGWALSGFLDLMSGKGPAAVLTPALVLVGIGLAFGLFGTWRLAARTQ